jgi:hypothetical protein
LAPDHAPASAGAGVRYFTITGTARQERCRDSSVCDARASALELDELVDDGGASSGSLELGKCRVFTAPATSSDAPAC